jgi:hypothetical protein
VGTVVEATAATAGTVGMVVVEDGITTPIGVDRAVM